jgi:hypothetical protein
MEPKKKIKKFSEFTQSNHPRGIFNHEIYEPTQPFRRIMELPMGDVLGLLKVDAEKPQLTSSRTNRFTLGKKRRVTTNNDGKNGSTTNKSKV